MEFLLRFAYYFVGVAATIVGLSALIGWAIGALLVIFHLKRPIAGSLLAVGFIAFVMALIG